MIASLKANKDLIFVLPKNANYVDVYSKNLATKYPEYIKINNYAIDLIESQQLSYKPIYALRSIELETLKTYIEINLANRFIRLLKSPASAPILFVKMFDNSFRFYINY